MPGSILNAKVILQLQIIKPFSKVYLLQALYTKTLGRNMNLNGNKYIPARTVQYACYIAQRPTAIHFVISQWAVLSQDLTLWISTSAASI